MIKNRKGFTLVELMVVLAILGLLAGIGVPQYMATLQRARKGADVAAVGTVQSAVNAILAESGKSMTAEEALALTWGGTSLLDGATALHLEDYLPGKVLPTLKSVTGGSWFVDATGAVLVKAGTPAVKVLP